MKKLLFLVIASCITSLSFAGASVPQDSKIKPKSFTLLCGFDASQIKKDAFKKYGESTSVIDVIETINGDTTVLEITTNKRTRTSTVLIYEGDGSVCIIGVGKEYKEGRNKEDDM